MPRVDRYVARSGVVTWRVRTRDSLGRQTTETFKTEAGAQNFADTVAAIGGPAAIAHKARHDIAADDYVPTVREWLTQHILQLTGVTERTRLDYLAMAKRTWLPHIGDLPLDVVDRAAVKLLVNALETQGLSAKSIANAHALLSSMFTSALDAGHITANPCVRVRLPRAREEERRGERFLTYAEYLQLLAHIPKEHRPFVVLLFGTGLRWSEATALQVRDVAAKAKPPVVRVTKAWKSTPGKGRAIGPPKSPKSRRSVILGAGVLDAIEPLLERPGDALLFATKRGRPLHHGNWRMRIWVPAIEAAGLDPAPRLHDARHTHASWLLEMGATLEQVQDQLGHESILTTRKIYGHLQPAMRTAMYDYATRALLPRPKPLEASDLAQQSSEEGDDRGGDEPGS